MSEVTELLITLSKHRNVLSRQVFKTIKGQAIAGDVIGAKKGLQKMIKEQKCYAKTRT